MYLLCSDEYNSHGPCLVVDDLIGSKTIRHSFELQGAALTITKKAARYCTGYYNLVERVGYPCPYQNQVEEPHTECSRCHQATGFNPAFYNAKDPLSPQQRAYNQEPHAVYLAYFAPHVIKVGIAYHERVRTRLLEQGARSGLVLAICPHANAARELEVFIKNTFPIVETVKSDKKRELLRLLYDPQEAATKLQQAQEEIQKAHPQGLTQSPVRDFTPTYLNGHTLNLEFNDLTGKAEYISGKIIGKIGDVLISEQGSKQYLLSLKKWVAHVIEIQDTTRDNATIYNPIQTSLF